MLLRPMTPACELVLDRQLALFHARTAYNLALRDVGAARLLLEQVGAQYQAALHAVAVENRAAGR